MNRIFWQDFLKNTRRIENCHITIGVFDGVHKGHTRLISKTQEKAVNAESLVITFTNNPIQILHPERFAGAICSLETKLERIAALGVNSVLLIDFSSEFSRLMGSAFFALLRKQMDIQSITIGWNFHCGYNQDMAASDIAQWAKLQGIETEVVSPLYEDGMLVSSSRIRNAVMAGDFGLVQRLLGNSFFLELNPEQIKKTQDSWYVEKDQLIQIIPPEGVYKVQLWKDKNNYWSTAVIAQSIIYWKDCGLETVNKIEFIAL